MRIIRTFGHGTIAADTFAALVREAGVEQIIDVRRFPASRRHPQFEGTAMAAWLGAQGVGYQWLPALGGRRKARSGSPNTGLRNEQFRGYADHMSSDEFAGGVKDLLDLAGAHMAAVMCAESLWWRCHRRLLADHLVLVEEVAVEHLLHDGRCVRHEPTPEARRVGGTVIYDVGTQGSLIVDDQRL